MPVLPEFQSSDAPGSVIDGALSYMDRASQLRMDQETHALQMAQEQIMMPVRQAQAKADIAAVGNKLAAMKQTEDMRAAAHEEMPQLREQWAQASRIDDPVERADALNLVLGRATKYQSVSELEPEITAWKNVWAQSNLTARTLQNSQLKSDTQLQIQQAKQEAQAAKDEAAMLRAKLASTTKTDVASISAGARTDSATIAAGARTDSASIAADSRRDIAATRGMTKAERYQQRLAEARDAGDTEAETLYGNLLKKEQSAGVGTAEGSEQIRAKLEESQQRASDPDASPEERQFWAGRAKFWQDRSTALNTRGVAHESKTDALLRKFTQTSPAPAAQPNAGTAAPSTTPAASTQPTAGDWQEITVGGQKFRIRKKG